MDYSSIVQIVLLPIIISMISNYVIWEFPYKRLRPSITISGIDTKVKDVQKATGTEKELRIKVEMSNLSNNRNAYRIDVYFEFMDKNDVVHYVREEHRPHLRSKNSLTIEPPIKYDAIKDYNIDKVNINVAYQNKYGAIFSTSKQKKIDIK